MKSSIFAEAKPLVKHYIATGESFMAPDTLVFLDEGNYGLRITQFEDTDFSYSIAPSLLSRVKDDKIGTAYLGYELSEFYAEDNPEDRIAMVTDLGGKLS